MFLSSSFLKRTVVTPERAFTTVDFPWATCPMVPRLIVAWREITSGLSGVSFVTSSVLKFYEKKKKEEKARYGVSKIKKCV